MADSNNDNDNDVNVDLTNLSLSQAILAPLDSIYQAQIHGARSFLNMLLQIGYPHVPEGTPVEDYKKFKPYPMDFSFQRKDDQGNDMSYKVSIPALALVPISSLAIDNAEVKFGMKISSAEKFQQIQESKQDEVGEIEKSGYKVNAYKRKWHLVQNPVSLKGEITPPYSSQSERSVDTSIEINIKLSKMPIPAGLEKLMNTLTNTAFIEEEKENINQ